MLKTIVFSAILLSFIIANSYSQEYKVVTPPEPSRIVRHAADELSRYLEKMTGQYIPVTDTASGSTITFILGNADQNPVVKALIDSGKLIVPKEYTAETSQEAYYLKSAGDKTVVLAGKSDVAVLYAVYDYLERYGKCGFFEDGDYIPSKAPQIRNVSYFTSPRLSVREFHGDLCGAFGLKKFHFGHRTFDDWVKFYDWLAKRRINMSGVFAGINSLWAGDAVETAFGVKVDDTPGEQYGAGWPTGWTWTSKERTKLMQQRVRYSRSIGIKTYWYCMYGHCPLPYKKLHPELKWVPSNYEHALLYPDEPLATELTAKFYKAVIDLYGTDHWYTDTPYCESMGAGSEEESLKLKIAAALEACKVFRQVDPNPTWVSDSWDFGSFPSLWTPERKKKYFDSIPRDMSYFFDATVDMNPLYASSGYFYGLPWGVGNLHSYQGDDHLHGDLGALIRGMNQAMESPGGSTLNGYFNLPEIHGANIMYWQLSTILAWDPASVKLDDYIRNFTLTRYGEQSYPTMRKAIDNVVSGVYSGQNYQPIYHKIGFGPSYWWPIFDESYQYGGPQLPGLANTVASLGNAVNLGLTQTEVQKDNPLYENDMVDWTKSYLVHMFNYSIISAHRAFKSGDIPSMRKWSKHAEDLLMQVELILSTRPDFSIQKTIDDAMSVPGTNPSTPAMIRQQCVNSLYATNDVYEQMHHYYRPKIDIYLKELASRAARGEKNIACADIVAECSKLDKHWLNDPIDVPASGHFNGTTMDAIRDAVKIGNRIQRDLGNRSKPRNLRSVISVECGSPSIENGLAIVVNGDGAGNASDFEGVKCWAIGPDSPDKQLLLYGSADDMQVFEAKAPVNVTIEYFDAGAGEAMLEYDSRDASSIINGAYKTVAALKLAGSNQWKQATMKLTDPRFANRQNSGADFRISMTQGVLRVRKIVFSKG
ncbi:MAG: alpha-N-acetylglucosaminidase TIM-barrel domain-containing protein [Armatimonadota bacterium]